MTRLYYFRWLWLAAGLSPILAANPANAQPETMQTTWHDLAEFSLLGKGWDEPERPFTRLPAKAEEVVRPPVWALSHASSGLYVEFTSNTPTLSLQWELRQEELALWHMPSVSVSGFDLYVRGEDGWDWLAVARPESHSGSESVLFRNLEPKERRFRLYFPLYNSVISARIGIPEKHEIRDAPNDNQPVIVFYGTSIVQGASASRAGMPYAALLGRRLGAESVNLGFSGNAHAEAEVAELLAELDPAVFVLDPLPNMIVETVGERIEHMIRVLREARPTTPIVLVDNIVFPASKHIEYWQAQSGDRNRKLHALHQRLTEEGVSDLYRIPADRLLGADGLDTVDGVHPTDVGFMRIADGMEPQLRFLLAPSSK